MRQWSNLKYLYPDFALKNGKPTKNLTVMFTLGVKPIRVVLILMLTQGIMSIKSSDTNTYAHTRYHAYKE